MIYNWLDAIFWLGMLCFFLYTWLFDTEAGKETPDSTRIKHAQDQMGISSL
jgi:hypothetical protein